MTKPIYKYSDTGIEKDGHAMFPQDVCKDLQYLQRKVAKLEERERKCPTMLESEARALVRALQEIRDELRMMESASPKQIVDAVRRLNKN